MDFIDLIVKETFIKNTNEDVLPNTTEILYIPCELIQKKFIRIYFYKIIDVPLELIVQGGLLDQINHNKFLDNNNIKIENLTEVINMMGNRSFNVCFKRWQNNLVVEARISKNIERNYQIAS